MEKSTFNRDYSDIQIESVKEEIASDGYIRKLYGDMTRGNVLLTLRPNKKCSFYLKGRNICDLMEGHDYKAVVDSLYLPIAKSMRNRFSEGLSEKMWQDLCNLNGHTFAECYEEIEDNAIMKADAEAAQVAGLYQFSPFATNDSDIILLDIESKFSYSNSDINDKRIDVVLYHVRNRQLIFIEVKRLADDRLQKKGELQQEIVHQMDGYKELIDNEQHEIIQEFNKTIRALNGIGGYSIPEIDENKDILLGLLITEYKNTDVKVVNSLTKSIAYPVVAIGNVANSKKETIDEWYKKLISGA